MSRCRVVNFLFLILLQLELKRIIDYFGGGVIRKIALAILVLTSSKLA